MRKSLVFIYFEYRSTHASYLPSQSTGTAKPGPFLFFSGPCDAPREIIYTVSRGETEVCIAKIGPFEERRTGIYTWMLRPVGCDERLSAAFGAGCLACVCD